MALLLCLRFPFKDSKLAMPTNVLFFNLGYFLGSAIRSVYCRPRQPLFKNSMIFCMLRTFISKCCHKGHSEPNFHMLPSTVSTDPVSTASSTTTSETSSTTPADTTAQTPAAISSYVYDAASGYYYDTTTGLYYDPNTQVIPNVIYMYVTYTGLFPQTILSNIRRNQLRISSSCKLKI